MKLAIPKLERRIAELKSVDPATIRERDETRFDALVQKIDATLVEIFGDNTIEQQRYRVHDLDTASINMLHETPLFEVIEGYKRGIDQAVSNLQTAVELLKEQLQDLGASPAGRAVHAFGELDLHPDIERAAGDLFRNGHYANAVEDACKVLDSLVKASATDPTLAAPLSWNMCSVKIRRCYVSMICARKPIEANRKG
jgi:hypothetical protein